MFTPFSITPMPVVVINIWSPLPRFTTLVSPVTNSYSGLCSRCTHGFHHTPQVVDRQPFFEDESSREIQRACAAHGQIVHRAMHCQPSNVAARKKDRSNHEGVGGKRQACPANAKHRLIVELV